ncbi:MAG: hypothetical protein RI948_256 [Bacteroidota bacterium]|jgi:hypothetical protein
MRGEVTNYCLNDPYWINTHPNVRAHFLIYTTIRMKLNSFEPQNIEQPNV